MTQKERLRLLGDFINRHGHVVTNALIFNQGDIAEAAKQAQAAWNAIKDDPEAVAAQDRTLMTTNGLRLSAERFRQEAAKVQAALDAWEKLTSEDDDET